MKFSEIIELHAARYPGMRPEDAVKLAYQSALGGGHLLSDPNAAEKRLFSEYSAISHDRAFRIEPLGDHSRVYIDCELTERELSLIFALFRRSAARPIPTEPLDARLAEIKKAAENGSFSFTVGELESYLEKFRAAGCPAVSHSEGYRRLYKPAYRVIDSRSARFLPLIFELAGRLESKPRLVLAIDGRAASGKSTSADLLCELFGGEVVRLDDFFLPFDMRTEERLAEPGGNLHRERFSSEVVEKLPGGFEYRVFDCSCGDFKPEPRRISGEGLLICEGAYSLHPSFGRYYDLAVFSDVTGEEQERRILNRNGEALLCRFKERWIPMEESYFKAFGIREGCDIVI